MSSPHEVTSLGVTQHGEWRCGQCESSGVHHGGTGPAIDARAVAIAHAAWTGHPVQVFRGTYELIETLATAPERKAITRGDTGVPA